LAGLAIVGLGLCAVLFAVGEESEGDTDSVRNLLLATKASMPQLANLNRLKHMTAKQQILYDSGMEDEADKNMNIAYQTFMKGKDEGVLAEYDNLNATISEEQDALVDYADEMGVSFAPPAPLCYLTSGWWALQQNLWKSSITGTQHLLKLDDDCFYYHSRRNNVVIAFGTLSSYD